MSTTFHIYRHAKTVWNNDGRLQGWLDSPLIEQVAPSKVAVDYVVSSDLQRAVQTATALFPNATVKTDARLREIYLGHWQGAYIAQLLHEADYTCYSETPEQFIPTTQESFAAVTARMLEVLRELAASEHAHIAIVSHGVAVACLQCYVDNAPLSSLWHYMLAGAQCITIQAEALF